MKGAGQVGEGLAVLSFAEPILDEQAFAPFVRVVAVATRQTECLAADHPHVRVPERQVQRLVPIFIIVP